MSMENKLKETIFYATAAMVPLAANALTQETTEPLHRVPSVPFQQATVDAEFRSPKLKLGPQTTLKGCFAKFDSDGTYANFDRVRDDHPWYDGLIYEMIRASADFLAAHPDPELKRQVNDYIETWNESMAPDLRWGLNGEIVFQEHNLTQPEN